MNYFVMSLLNFVVLFVSRTFVLKTAQAVQLNQVFWLRL